MDQDSSDALENKIHDISLLAKRISRGDYKQVSQEELISMPDFQLDVAPGKRKRSRKRGPLQLNEKMEIVEKVLVSFESHKDVARAYRVSTYVVNHLISKV